LRIHCGSLGDNSGSDYILYRGSKERLETLRMRKRNTIRLMMGMIDQMQSPKARDIGLVTTTDWTK